MSTMTIYHNTSDQRCLTKNLLNATNVTGSYKENPDELSIVVTLRRDSDYNTYNYIKVSGKGFYFINSREYLANGMVELHCTLDTLSTYANDIKNQTAVLSRSENNFNRYIHDPSAVVLSKKRVQNYKWNYQFAISGQTHIVVQNGGEI